MAKIAILAAGKPAEQEDVHAVMRRAVELGIIHGMGNGVLAPEGVTNRAQAVLVIQRMLTINSGGTLPVNEEALRSVGL